MAAWSGPGGVMTRRSMTAGVFMAAIVLVVGTQPDQASAGDGFFCCDCDPVNPMMPGACNQPCVIAPAFNCLQICDAADSPATPCKLDMVFNAPCAATGCPTTGCCTVNASAARTAGGSMCVETTAGSCPLLPGGTSFVAGGSCVGGLSGSCASPTATATVTATAPLTATVTVTQTATITQTPTNTRVPNGGDCLPPSQCSWPLF